MSYINHLGPIAGTGRTAPRQAGPSWTWLQRTAAWWSTRRRQRRQSAALYALSDRTLQDIGIHRSEIGSLVHHGKGDSSRRHGAA